MYLECDQAISLEECHIALSNMANNKTPGSDGYTVEFFVFFWEEVKNLILDSYNHALSSGQLSLEQKRGVLTLVPKKKKMSDI